MKAKCDWCKFEYPIGETTTAKVTWQDGHKDEMRLCKSCYKQLREENVL